MISWMQKHNKYLVWTIWIATIAFIGAGFVGWGSYNFGSKASAIAKVGSIEIKQEALNMAYQNLYRQYNQALQGQLDDKKAKELGLVQQAFAQVEVQAKILNFAKDAGIIVSDAELAAYLEKIPAFQKEGRFSKTIYKSYLSQQRLKAKSFEARLREDLIVQKVFSLLNSKALPLEVDAVQAAMLISDSLLYKTLSSNDINLTVQDADLKAYWQKHKENYMTPTAYTLAIVWTPTKDTEVTEQEVEAFYKTNSFNYTDKEGKVLTLKEAKEAVTRDTKLKKTKKRAQKAYIAFKKGKTQASETITLNENDARLTPEIWALIVESTPDTLLKPKAVKDQYATIKLVKVQPSRVMRFEEAKTLVTQAYLRYMKKEKLFALADEALKQLSKENAKEEKSITLEHPSNLVGLNVEENREFTQKLFTLSKEKGIITIKDKLVVYKITDQTLLSSDQNTTNRIAPSVTKLKHKIFETNFIQLLDSKYVTKTYRGGLKN
jgi:peptidyl-prolyl cis-trans isomerase D